GPEGAWDRAGGRDRRIASRLPRRRALARRRRAFAPGNRRDPWSHRRRRQNAGASRAALPAKAAGRASFERRPREDAERRVIGYRPILESPSGFAIARNDLAGCARMTWSLSLEGVGRQPEGRRPGRRGAGRKAMAWPRPPGSWGSPQNGRTGFCGRDDEIVDLAKTNLWR